MARDLNLLKRKLREHIGGSSGISDAANTANTARRDNDGNSGKLNVSRKKTGTAITKARERDFSGKSLKSAAKANSDFRGSSLKRAAKAGNKFDARDADEYATGRVRMQIDKKQPSTGSVNVDDAEYLRRMRRYIDDVTYTDVPRKSSWSYTQSPDYSGSMREEQDRYNALDTQRRIYRQNDALTPSRAGTFLSDEEREQLIRKYDTRYDETGDAVWKQTADRLRSGEEIRIANMDPAAEEDPWLSRNAEMMRRSQDEIERRREAEKIQRDNSRTQRQGRPLGLVAGRANASAASRNIGSAPESEYSRTAREYRDSVSGADAPIRDAGRSPEADPAATQRSLAEYYDREYGVNRAFLGRTPRAEELAPVRRMRTDDELRALADEYYTRADNAANEEEAALWRRTADEITANPEAYRYYDAAPTQQTYDLRSALENRGEQLSHNAQKARERLAWEEETARWDAVREEAKQSGWVFTDADYSAYQDRVNEQVSLKYYRQSMSNPGGPMSPVIDDYRPGYTLEEASTYEYLLSQGRNEEAAAYVRYIQPIVAERTNANLAKEVAAGDPVTQTLLAIATNPGKIINGIDIAMQWLERKITGSNMPIDVHSTGGYRVISNTGRETVTEKLSQYGTLGDLVNNVLGTDYTFDAPILNGLMSMTWGDVYGLGVDVANATTNRLLFGNMSGAAMMLESGADSFVDAQERGATNDEMFLFGVISGLAEGIGETIDFGALKRGWAQFGGGKTGWKFFAALGVGAAMEGTEGGLQETATELITRWADEWLMGENSRFSIRVRELIAEGYTPQQAADIAQDEADSELFKTFVMGGMAQVTSYVGGHAVGIPKMITGDARETGRRITALGNADFLQEVFAEEAGGNVQMPKTAGGIGRKYNQYVKAQTAELDKAQSRAVLDYYDRMRGNIGEDASETDIATARKNTPELKAVRDALTRLAQGKKVRGRQQQLLQIDESAKRTVEAMRSGEIKKSDSTVKREQDLAYVKAATVLPNIKQLRESADENTARTPMGETTEDTRRRAEAVGSTMTVTEDAGSSVGGEEIQKVNGIKAIANATQEATVTVTMADGSSRDVKLSDVSFGSDTDANVYEYAAVMATPELANQFRFAARETNMPLEKLANSMNHAYDMGVAGYRNPATVQASSLVKPLNDVRADLVQTAFEMGKRDRGNTVAGRIEQAGKRIAEYSGREWRAGRVITTGIDMSSLKPIQRENIRQTEFVAQLMGINVELFESKANAAGVFEAENGSYNAATNTMRLDINAGRNEAGNHTLAQTAMLRTMSHELTHAIQRNSPEQYEQLKNAVLDVLEAADGYDLNARVDKRLADAQAAAEKLGGKPTITTKEQAIDEIIADACEMMLRDTDAIKRLADAHPDAAKSIGEKVIDFIDRLLAAVRKLFGKENNAESRALAKALEADLQNIREMWSKALVETSEVSGREIEVSAEVQQRIDNDQAIHGIDEIKNSLRFDEKYMDAAEKRNKQTGFVSASVMRDAAAARATVRDFFRDPANKELLKLPADVTANTFYSDASYGGSEENTTVCIRSMAAQQLMDEVSKNLGRPLTVQDTLLISQEIAALTDKPECFYCYVATDRRAYREYLVNYLTQRDEVIKKYRNGADREALYTEFLNKRDDTPNMRARFDMWLNAVDNGVDLITGKDLASLEDLFAEVGKHKPKRVKVNGKSTIKLTGSRLDQLWDATSYAQSASWAKKMNGYAAYNNHILKWSQKRINELNSKYGVRMYSFSDYSPAFVLENMQMITDAAVRGLNVLAYTKEMDFAEIFAPTGANINVSVFATEVNGQITSDGMQGADWERAKALRNKYGNVGTVMVATNDRIMKWAMEQDWIDVVIPYHLVRTGQKVADYFGYKNYTSVSGDKKTLNYKKGDPTSISPVEHRNDIIAYVDALQRYGLSPRFADQMQGYEQYIAGEITPNQFRAMNPYYMKLVNETRRSYADTKPVQPVFNTEAAMASIDTMIKQGGYYQPIGGSMEKQSDIAEDVADKIKASRGKQDTQFSTRDQTDTPEFKAWFGDSEVVDDDGKPLVVYHTTNDDFTVFDKSYLGKGTDSNASDGYLAATAHVGHWFNTQPLLKKAGGDRAMGVYLSANRMRDVGTLDGLIEEIWNQYESQGYEYDSEDPTIEQAREAGEVYAAYLESRGYNGIMLEDTEFGGMSYVVFEPTQIKSATDNVGTFDPNNPDIRYSMRDPDYISDREILANVLADSTQTESERRIVEEYQAKLGKLNQAQADLNRAREVIREYAYRPSKDLSEADRLALEQARKDATRYADMLARADKSLLKLQAMEPIKNVLVRAREHIKDRMRDDYDKRERDARLAERMHEGARTARLQREYQQILNHSREENRAARIRLREDFEQRLTDLRTRKDAQIKRLRESQESVALRKTLVRKANSIRKAATNPTDARHIPDNLVKTAGKLMEFFNADDTFDISDRLLQRLTDCRDAYAEIAKEVDDPDKSYNDFVEALFDKSILDDFDELRKSIRERLQSEERTTSRTPKMNAYELRLLSSILDHINFLIRDAGKTFIDGRNIETGKILHDIYTQMYDEETGRAKYNPGQSIMRRIAESDKAALRPLSKAADKADSFNTGMMTPTYFFRMLGGQMQKLGEDLINGETTYALNWQKAKRQLADINTRYNHDKWAYDGATITIKPALGSELKLTREQALCIWATAKRERLSETPTAHLALGGVVLDRDASKPGFSGTMRKDVTGTPLGDAELDQISEFLTDEQKAYADAMVEFCSNPMARLGNETSTKLQGVKIFREGGYYFPFRTPGEFLKTDVDKSNATALYRNEGFTKRLRKGASTPVLITDFSDAIAVHIDKMCRYNALAVPQFNMLRILNYKAEQNASVKSLISGYYGTDALGYITQFLKDVHHTDKAKGKLARAADKVAGMDKRRAVSGSLSVAVQQMSALTKAMALVDMKYFRAPVSSAKWFEEAMQYSGTAVIKDMGRFDTGTGFGAADWLLGRTDRFRLKGGTKLEKAGHFIDKASGYFAEMADKITWAQIWQAVKREQAAKTGLDIRSEELKQIAGKRFDEVVRLTQVYDSVMAKSQIMRQPGSGTYTAFMTEQTVTYNMVADAMREGMSGNPKAAIRTIAAVVGTIIYNNLLKGLVTGSRDDEDEEARWIERYLKNVVSGTVNDMVIFNYMPRIRDYWSVALGWDVARPDTSIITRGFNLITTIGNENKSTEEKLYAAAHMIGAVSPLPVGNIWRDLKAANNSFQAIKGAATGERPFRDGWVWNAARNALAENTPEIARDRLYPDTGDRLYAAVVKGDDEAIERELEHLADYDGKDEKEARTAFRTEVKEAYLDGEIDDDRAVELVTKYGYSSSKEPEKYVSEWQFEKDYGFSYSKMKDKYLEGKITYEEAVEARQKYGGVTKDKAEDTVDGWTEED